MRGPDLSTGGPPREDYYDTDPEPGCLAYFLGLILLAAIICVLLQEVGC